MFGVKGFRLVAISVGGCRGGLGAENVADPYDRIRADHDHDDEKQRDPHLLEQSKHPLSPYLPVVTPYRTPSATRRTAIEAGVVGRTRDGTQVPCPAVTVPHIYIGSRCRCVLIAVTCAMPLLWVRRVRVAEDGWTLRRFGRAMNVAKRTAPA